MLAAHRPSLHGALLAAKAAGYTHVTVDGTLIFTDRIGVPGPTRGVDLWWSGKHHHHGGNIQVVSAPDGWPLWTSDVRPGREHDTTAARADPDLLATIRLWVGDGALALADLGYEGEADLFRIPAKKPAGGDLTSTSRPTTPSTGRCAASVNARAPYSRPRSRLFAGSTAAPAGSGTSSLRLSSSSTPNTTVPHNPINQYLS